MNYETALCIQFILFKQFLIFISLAVSLCSSFFTKLLLVLLISIPVIFKKAVVKCTPSSSLHLFECLKTGKATNRSVFQS